MRYEVRFTNQFKKDLKLAKKQGKDTDKLFEVIEKLANGEKLDAKLHASFRGGLLPMKQFYDIIRTQNKMMR